MSDHYAELDRLIADTDLRNFLVDLMSALPNVVGILDEDLRLVYSNQELLDAASIESFADAFQLRPGELFKCVNAGSNPQGCGHSVACQLCGALKAMKDSRAGNRKVTEECRILGVGDNGTRAYNFRFTSKPFRHGSNSFYLISMEDISNRARKEELERIFFHDMLNALGGLSGVIGLIKERNEMNEYHLEILEEIYSNLYNTILEQKEFSAAEKNELRLRPETISSLALIRKVAAPFAAQPDHDVRIETDPASADVHFTTDASILTRILTNMVKNAIEASRAGDRVTIAATRHDEALEFTVHNPGSIPPEIQYQIFERSFSTKGEGRGLGTYSMKLLGENYLKGRVEFESNPKEGTTFRVRLPA